MKMNHYIVNTPCPPYPPSLLRRSHRSRAVLNHLRRAPLPAVMLAVAVVLATGCSSTGAGFNARLISPLPSDSQATTSEDGNWYQPSQSPGFDPDLFGS